MHRILLFFVCLVLLASGPARAQDAGEAAEAVDAAYLIGRGDVLRVTVYDEEGLSGTYTVDETGKVEFPLVGRLDAESQTISSLEASLTRQLGARYLVNPHVTVVVETFGSQRVQVLGAVKKPGPYHLSGYTTLLDILGEAGGINTERSSQEVQVKRAGEDAPIVVNLSKLLTQGQGNIPVRDGDVIYVAESEVIYVSGQVAKPGAVPWRDGLTVTQALTAAGGASSTANLRKVYIMRGGQRNRVNVRRVLKGRDADMRVQAGDQLFVDESVF